MNFTITLRKCKASSQEDAGKSKVYIRCYEGKNIDFRATTAVAVYAEYWDSKNFSYRDETPIDLISPFERLMVNQYIKRVLKMVKLKYKPGCDGKWLKDVVQKCELRLDDEPTEQDNQNDEEQTAAPIDAMPFYRPKKYSATHANKTESEKKYEQMLSRANDPNEEGLGVIECFERYLAEAEFNDWHRQAQTSVMHRLQRYERWLAFNNDNESFKLMLDDFDKEQVEDYANYMEHEAEYKEKFPEFFAQFQMRNPKWIRPVSRNAVICGIKRLNMFLNWAVKKELLKDTSFRNVVCDQQIYGTPYYLTIEERDKVANLDLSDNPRLETHRDKFIFQCHVGCRNNDLELFTWEHINGDFLEYVPHKNILAGRTQLVRCPLDETAKEILMNIDPEAQLLFAHYCTDWYRQDIKKILKLAGIDRKVMVFNPRINKAEPHPLYEVAATHLARRTFIGNLYKQVQDPALIASLTGHTETSTSFTRYRAIDDDIKRDVLKFLE